MYYPFGFRRNRSIELAKLVISAYEQFDHFEEGLPWSLPSNYTLIRELNYAWKGERTLDKKKEFFDFNIRRVIFRNKKEKQELPLGFICRRGRKLFLIFRGTKTAKEWVNNLNTSLQDFIVPQFGSVHEGFLQTYLSVREAIFEELKKQPRWTRLYIAGHSLGAAFSTLAAADLELSLKRGVRAIYTFGSPRVGDDLFAESYNRYFSKKTFRVVNTSDIVTSIPFPSPILGLFKGYFTHVDTPVDFNCQCNDVELSHSMKTYLQALISPPRGRKFLRNRQQVRENDATIETEL